jgi:hypothetical protein
MKKSYALILALLAASLMVPVAFGQSLISGDIAGTVSDPSHAVVPGASVELKSLDCSGRAAIRSRLSKLASPARSFQSQFP